jgi:hypothetical protein
MHLALWSAKPDNYGAWACKNFQQIRMHPRVPYAKTAELIHPCEGAFHDPAPLPQPAAMVRIAHCEQGQDVAGAQSTADVLRIVGPVPQHTVRATARHFLKIGESDGPILRTLPERSVAISSYRSHRILRERLARAVSYLLRQREHGCPLFAVGRNTWRRTRFRSNSEVKRGKQPCNPSSRSASSTNCTCRQRVPRYNRLATRSAASLSRQLRPSNLSK